MLAHQAWTVVTDQVSLVFCLAKVRSRPWHWYNALLHKAIEVGDGRMLVGSTRPQQQVVLAVALLLVQGPNELIDRYKSHGSVCYCLWTEPCRGVVKEVSRSVLDAPTVSRIGIWY